MGAALLAGALAALAMPPLYWLPLAVRGHRGVRLAVGDRADGRRARCCAAGPGASAISPSAPTGSSKPSSCRPPTSRCSARPIGAAAWRWYLGLFPGLAAGLTRRLVERWPALGGRYRRLVLLAIAWTAAEWLRGHIFTGYPWNPLGHVWAFATPLLQGAALVGVYGLGTLTFLILAAPTAGWRAVDRRARGVGHRGLRRPEVMEAGGRDRRTAGCASCSPMSPQAEKWRPENRARQLAEAGRTQPARRASTAWPRWSGPRRRRPFIIQPGSPASRCWRRAAPPGGYLLAGAPRGRRRCPRTASGIRCWRSTRPARSSAHLRQGPSRAVRRIHPVSQAARRRSRGLIGRGSFEEGESRVTAEPAGPAGLLAADLLRGDLSRRGHRSRRAAALAANITNDAWFGISSGPYQHLASARLRAVEEGLPMIRAANTGVSAVIDAYGRVLASLDMEREGVIDHALPPARAATPVR